MTTDRNGSKCPYEKRAAAPAIVLGMLVRPVPPKRSPARASGLSTLATTPTRLTADRLTPSTW